VLMTNRRAGELIDLIIEYRPDIFVTLESDHWWQQQLDTLQTTYPYSVKCPLDNLYGMHVYSKLELLEPQVEFLIEKDVPSMTCKIPLRDQDTVRMHFLHPAPPSPTENEESTERDAELVLIARRVAGQDNPVIVTGDMNDVAWSATTRLFRKVS
ncbi:MAG TPA: endonuclease, partial [Porticoccaceae bacterium]|nr:endonuclease [Porticoccaceae bacterium]